eukprot:PLAT3769.1.p1 GENE.PLAT3769.1~~PLAT3769.1.p1  ORF type:complete len:398 (-),score=134.85 PLAT3769.1:67-1227(-)
MNSRAVLLSLLFFALPAAAIRVLQPRSDVQYEAGQPLPLEVQVPTGQWQASLLCLQLRCVASTAAAAAIPAAALWTGQQECVPVPFLAAAGAGEQLTVTTPPSGGQCTLFLLLRDSRDSAWRAGPTVASAVDAVKLPVTLSSERERQEAAVRAAGGLPFSAAFYINLDRRPALAAAMEGQVKRSWMLSQMGVQRVAAVDGLALKLDALQAEGVLLAEDVADMLQREAKATEVTHGLLTRGAIGCALSHIRMWRLAVERNETVLVMEDDSRVRDDFDATLAALLPELPRDFDLLYFFLAPTLVLPPNLRRLSEHVFRVLGDAYTTSAYVVTPRGAARLLSQALPIRQQVDSYMRKTIAAQWEDMVTLLAHPQLITPITLHGSDIQRQ